MYVPSQYSVPAKDEVPRVDSSKKGGIVDMGDFIKLFVAQMEHQDPLNPADGSEFFSQTAQITMVEQLVDMNTKNDRTLTAAYLGREVTASVRETSGQTHEVSGVVTDISYQKDGTVLLGLHDGSTVALSDVTNVAIYTGN